MRFLLSASTKRSHVLVSEILILGLLAILCTASPVVPQPASQSSYSAPSRLSQQHAFLKPFHRSQTSVSHTTDAEDEEDKRQEVISGGGRGNDKKEPGYGDVGDNDGRNKNRISPTLFRELEELSRIVDISYCVGVAGISKPFQCASRCDEFEGFELVTTWNTGVMMSDSSGYMVLSHPPAPPRIILAFRGTYSVANTIVDLSTVPQEYVPYPGDEDEDEGEENESLRKRSIDPLKAECNNCTVHAGFMRAWRETRPYVLSQMKELVQKYPGYRVTLVGHSLGGAIAALASLDFQSRGWNPHITTFGEPRIGNAGLVKYLDGSFASESSSNDITESYRRVTHVDDPVPLLPLTEWGYRMHAGEIYITKHDLSPEVGDLRYCYGDEDPECIAGAESPRDIVNDLPKTEIERVANERAKDGTVMATGIFEVPARWRIWELFFAHRDYFWRLGLCIPGGDPKDWYRKYPHDENDEL